MCKKFTKSDEYQIIQQINYNPITGVLRRVYKSKGSRARLGIIKGYAKREGHLKVSVCSKEVYLHQLAWFLHYGVWAAKAIDHKDRDPTNNKIDNLRELSHQGNAQNRASPMRSNSSGYLGVYLDKRRNKFVAEITVNNKKKYIGRFSTARAAHEAYIQAKRIYHKGYIHHDR